MVHIKSIPCYDQGDFISGLGRWPILDKHNSVHQKSKEKFNVIILTV